MYKDIQNIASVSGADASPGNLPHRVAPTPAIHTFYIDACTRHVRLQAYDNKNALGFDQVIPGNSDLRGLLTSKGHIGEDTGIGQSGRIQTLLSAEGDVDDEALTLAVLKASGPQRYCRPRGSPAEPATH